MTGIYYQLLLQLLLFGILQCFTEHNINIKLVPASITFEITFENIRLVPDSLLEIKSVPKTLSYSHMKKPLYANTTNLYILI
jgi:hypothetical protein